MISRSAKIAIILMAIMLARAEFVLAQQWDEPKKSTHSFDVILDGGLTTTSWQFEERKNWRHLFMPSGGDMTLHRQGPPVFLGLKVGYSQVLFGDEESWQFRLPISYEIFGLSFDGINRPYFSEFARHNIRSIVLRWWDDVTFSDLVARRVFPRIGLEVSKGKTAVGVSFQKYSLFERNYRGIDCQGCVNYSKVIDEVRVGSGISSRIDVFFSGALGVFAETTGGSRAISFGMTIRGRIRR